MRGPDPQGLKEPESLEIPVPNPGGRTGPQTGHPQREIPRATGHESRVTPLIKRALAIPALSLPGPLGADRAVGSVPGDSADVLQLPLRRVIRGDSLEWVLAQVPSPLNDLQRHGQVPVLVEEDLVAQEGEVDLPDLLEQLEGSGAGIRGWARPGSSPIPLALIFTSVKWAPGLQ